MAGLLHMGGMSAYNASKAGMVALSDGLLSELDPYGVKVSVVCPTFFLAKHPEVASRLRGALQTHNEAQAEPLWPWITTKATNIDRDLSQDDQPEDEFTYMSN